MSSSSQRGCAILYRDWCRTESLVKLARHQTFVRHNEQLAVHQIHQQPNPSRHVSTVYTSASWKARVRSGSMLRSCRTVCFHWPSPTAQVYKCTFFCAISFPRTSTYSASIDAAGYVSIQEMSWFLWARASQPSLSRQCHALDHTEQLL